MQHFVLMPALVLVLLLGCTVGSPATSVYDLDSLVSDLESAGARIEVTGETWDSMVFDSEVQAQAISIEGARATVLTYANAAAAESEASRISPDGYNTAGVIVDWADTPHFFKKGKLIVYYVGNEESIQKILEGALGPQFAGG